MNIAVDARELTGRPTGVGTYLASLAGEWASMPAAQAHRWTFYAPDDVVRQADHTLTARRGLRLPEPFVWRDLAGRPGTWWEQRVLAAAIGRERPDVLFAPAYTAPVLIGVPLVLTIHDVSFCAHPEWFGAREGMRRRLLTRWSAKKARRVLTDSDFQKNEIVSRLGVDADRVEVIRPGITLPAAPLPADGRPPVVLFVGSILNRRHVPDLIRAFALLAGRVPDARLEIVGDNRTHPREDLKRLVDSLGIASRVGLRSYVAGDELARLYASARVFAFLSEYEGFGLTPLEALARSVPVVVLDTPVAREVYEDAALYVTRGDLSGTAEALTLLLVDAAARAAQLERAAAVLARYNWHDAACATLAVLDRAARTSAPHAR